MVPGCKTFKPFNKSWIQESFDSKKKSRIRETKHLSTDADSSTDTKVGWTKNSQKPNFFEKQKKIIQNAQSQKTSRDRPFSIT